MLKPAVKMLGFLIEGAGVIGTIGTVATVGEVVAKRAGVLPKEKSLIGEATHFALDVAGFSGASKQSAAAPQLGAASTIICPLCQGTKPLDISGPATLKNCDNHEAAVVALGGYVESMYDGWAQHYGIDIGAASKCGKKPDRANYQTAAGFQALAYNAAMVQWQQCSMDEKAAAEKVKADAAAAQKAQAKAIADAKKSGVSAQKKVSDLLLATQQKQYDKKIADLQAQQAAEKDAEKQAAIQAQIDAANAGKAAAEKLAADLQAKATSDAQAKQIADLQAQVLAAGQKPGGMDQLLMQYLMMQQQMQQQQMQQQQMQQQQMQQQQMQQQQMQQQQMQQQQMQQSMMPQMMASPDGGLIQDGGAMPWSAPGEFVPVVEQDQGGGDQELYFEGQAQEPSLGNYFGVEGLSDDDGQVLFNAVQSGNISSDDIAELLREQDASYGACLSGCSIPR